MENSINIIENQRFKQMFDYLKANRKVYNQKDFADNIGSDPVTVSQIMNNIIRVPNNMFAKITKAFPFINVIWLKTGEGEMLNLESSCTFYGGDGPETSDRTVSGLIELLKLKEEALQRSQLQIDKLIDLVSKKLSGDNSVSNQ